MNEAEIVADLDSRCELLDVRPLLKAGKEPFQDIMQAVGGLAPGRGLAVRTTFEAHPLLGVMASKGYQGVFRQLDEDDWIVEFTPSDIEAKTVQTPAAPVEKVQNEILDVRGLEPPEPLQRVLAAVEGLPPGATLTVVHERQPAMLYPRLDELGLKHRTEESGQSLFHIHITRPISPEA